MTNSSKINFLATVCLGLFIAIGLSTSGYFLSQTIINAKMINTAEAKGLAVRRVVADTANWSIKFKVISHNKNDISTLYNKAEKQQSVIISILKANGLKDEEIKIGTIDYSSQEFRDDKQVLVDTIHSLVGDISIETNNVELVSKVRNKVNKLIAQGVDLTNYKPTYLFTKLNDIKPEMLKEAAVNARIAANEFAQNAGVKVSSIKSARQGSFRITDVGENYGDTAKVEKEVRVVTNIEFWLSN